MNAALLLLLTACPEPARDDTVFIETDDGGFSIDRFEYPNQAGVFPTHSTDLATARDACAHEGKRLCTAAEWRRACLGRDGSRRYGYGPRHIPRICHTEVDLPSGHTSMMNADNMVAASAAYLDCQTPEGVYDMIGNVEEWVLDDWRGVGGMLEGGAWYTNKAYANCTGDYSREPDYRLNPTQPVFSAGFRCCTSEAAPTEADLSPAQLHADAAARLARAPSSDAAYVPGDEISLGGQTWMDRYEYPNRAGEYPRVGVTWTEAAELCAAADKRLCTTWEWEQSCGGRGGMDYPYGPEFVAAACGVRLDAAPRAGQYLACSADDGARDLVGGVWEWTATPLDAEALRSRPDERLREIRGGSWQEDERKGVCRPVVGYPAAPEDVPFPDVGFRCCRGPVADEEADQAWVAAARCPSGLVPVGHSCVERTEHLGPDGVAPLGGLDWEGARAACAGAGLRVCREDEWERACEGPHQRRWPYGNTFDAEACNLHEQPRLVGRVEADPAGSHPRCATPEGVLDLSGNLWEWVEDARGEGVLRGGGWNFSAGLGQCRARADADDDYVLAQLGVRCCADPR